MNKPGPSNLSEELSHWSPAELAAAPATHPAHAELAARLKKMPAAERERWEAEAEQAASLRSALAAPVAMRPGLALLLRDIPSDIVRESRWKLMMRQPVGVAHIAAAILFAVAGTLGYNYWLQGERYRMEVTQNLLPDNQAQVIAAAVSNGVTRFTPAPAQTASLVVMSEAAVSKLSADLADAAKASHLSFDPVIVRPQPDIRLVSAELAAIDGVPVVVTRWAGSDSIWTLYQLPAHAFNAPTSFDETMVSTHLAAGCKRVVIWTDGDCGRSGASMWALVAHGPLAGNPFRGNPAQ